MMDALILVNFMIAAASVVLSVKNSRGDRRNRWPRMLTCLSALYFSAFYLYMMMVGTHATPVYVRFGITLILTSIAAREIYDAFRR